MANVFHQVDNTLDVQLVFSRDGHNWNRTNKRQPFLNNGPSNSWDQYQVAVPSTPITINDKTLIYYGADVNIKTKTNDNLLHIAAKNGNKSLVEVLVKKGVDAGAKNKDNKRPEKIAKANGYKDLAKYLKKARKGKL